jgi:hypothetical protein
MELKLITCLRTNRSRHGLTHQSIILEGIKTKHVINENPKLVKYKTHSLHSYLSMPLIS